MTAAVPAAAIIVAPAQKATTRIQRLNILSPLRNPWRFIFALRLVDAYGGVGPTAWAIPCVRPNRPKVYFNATAARWKPAGTCSAQPKKRNRLASGALLNDEDHSRAHPADSAG